MSKPRVELAPSRTVFDRLLDITTGVDILYVVVMLVGAVGWGVYTVGGWILEAWRNGAWWSFTLMAATSAFLLGGVIWELSRRRPGAFALVTVSVSLVLGIGHVLSDSSWFTSNP